MPNPTTASGIRDNHGRGVVAEFLKERIRSGSRLSVVSAFFTIYAYDALKEHLDSIEHLDFLFGEPRFISSLDPEKTEKKSFILDADGLQLANKLQQKRVARECADWIRRKVDIRSIRHSQLLHGKMYHIANGGVEEAKRLESSVDSFRLTLQRTIEKIDRLEERITAFEQHLNENPDLDYDSLTPDQLEDPDFDQEEFTIGGRRRIHLGHIELPEWLKEVRRLERELKAVRHRYFTARRYQTKKALRKRDRELCKQLAKALVDSDECTPSDANRLVEWNPYNTNTHAGFFDPGWMFGLEGEGGKFDLVIGNPPYVRQEELKAETVRDSAGKNRPLKEVLKEQYECYTGTADLYVCFFERSLQLLRIGGMLNTRMSGESSQAMSDRCRDPLMLA